MSSFCLLSLVTNFRLSMYMTSPVVLFISGSARPSVNSTPKFICLVESIVVVTPLNEVWIPLLPVIEESENTRPSADPRKGVNLEK